MNNRSIVITSTLVCALATGALAQRADAPRSNQQEQAQGLRQARSGRLVIPITGSLTTPATPLPPTEPTPPQPPETPPPTSEPPTTPSEPPTTPSEPPQTPSAEPPTTPIPAAPGSEADVNPQVTGSFSIRRFAQTTEGEVAAVGMLTLSLTDPSTGAARTIVTQAAVPVERAGGESSAPAPSPVAPTTAASSVALSGDSQVATTAAAPGCETLSLVLRPVELDVLGMAVQLDQVNVDFVARSTGRLGIVLCGAAGVMDRSVSPADQMKILNTLLDAVG